MSTVTIIGAGSAVFTFEIITDLLLTPALTAAVCSPAEIRKMFEEMSRVETPYLPDWMQG